jgi:hypothetical protein
MSNISKLMMQAAAGAGGGGIPVEEAFSTTLYTGNGSTQTITNGIDLAGEGGLVWTKNRGSTTDHIAFDSERGSFTQLLRPNLTNESFDLAGAGYITSVSSTGYSVGNSSATNAINKSGINYASWTFRKAPRFFDVVTWTGDSNANTVISHSLDSVPGFIITKRLQEGGWGVFHRSLGTGKYLNLNATFAASTDANFFPEVTSTGFRPGSDNDVNGSGNTYVAYLFAHDPLGPSGDDGLIACGSYNNPSNNTFVNVGFEPQFLILKKTSADAPWYMFDNMSLNGDISPSATGFTINSSETDIMGTGAFIYIAIRAPST